MVRRPAVIFHRRCSQCSNIFFFETAGPIKARLYLKPPWIGGTKSFSWHLDRKTKMAATPMYDKIPSKILCMYVCICIYIIYMYGKIPLKILCMYVCIYIYIYIRACVHIYICECMYV